MSNLIARLTAVLAACAVTMIAPALAQDKDDVRTLYDRSENAGVFSFSTEMPSSPALALAGIDASKTTTVGEVRKFVLTLPTAFSGDDLTAVALDISPAELIQSSLDDHNTLSAYVSANYAQRLMRRTKLSLLVRDGKEDDDPAKATKSLLSIGLTTSILDDSDPLMALRKQSGNARYACIDVMDPKVAAYLRTAAFSPDLDAGYATLVELRGTVDAIRDGMYAGDESSKRALLEQSASAVAGVRGLMIAHRDAIVREDGDSAAPPKITVRVATIGDDNVKSAEALRAEIDELVKLLQDSESGYNEIAETPKDVLDAYETCQKAVKFSLSMAPSVDIGFAALWRGDPSGLDSLESDGSALWVSAHKGIWSGCQAEAICVGNEPYLVWGLSARAAKDETVSTGDSALKEAKSDNWQAWTGLEFYSKEWRAAARYGYGDTDFQDATAAQFSKAGDRWLLSADFAVGDTTWIGLSYGKAAGSIDALDGETFKVTLRFSEPSRYELFK